MEPAELLLLQIRAAGLPEPETERQFVNAYGRRFRFDFAWSERLLAMEFEGGSWSSGGHTRGKHFESDCTKYNFAVLLGWKVLRVNNHMIEDGRAILLLEAALGCKSDEDVILTLAKHRCDKCLTKAEKLKRAARRLKETR